MTIRCIPAIDGGGLHGALPAAFCSSIESAKLVPWKPKMNLTTIHAQFAGRGACLLFVDRDSFPLEDGNEVPVVFKDGSEQMAVIFHLGAGLAGSGGEQREPARFDVPTGKLNLVDRFG